jgi:hypothetical protein
VRTPTVDHCASCGQRLCDSCLLPSYPDKPRRVCLDCYGAVDDPRADSPVTGSTDDQDLEGLPSLRGAAKRRAERDNAVTHFILELLEDHDARGGGSMREGPGRSLHWRLPKEQEMWGSGRWEDKRYAECALRGARCKQQRIRYSIGDFSLWPPMNCHLIHNPGEWEPQVVEGRTCWPSREEAEYTATMAFQVAVSTSWWAMRLGYARMRVPRLLQAESTGNRRPWPRGHPKALGEWAMLPMARGLSIQLPRAGGIPAQVSANEVGLGTTRGKQAELPAGHVYIGRGHYPYRLQKNKWAAPLQPGIRKRPDASFADHMLVGPSAGDDFITAAREAVCSKGWSALLAMQNWMYFEWVESPSNWADGISREILEDVWHQRHELQPTPAPFRRQC